MLTTIITAILMSKIRPIKSTELEKINNDLSLFVLKLGLNGLYSGNEIVTQQSDSKKEFHGQLQLQAN